MAVRIDHVTLTTGVVSTLTFTGPGNKVKVEVLVAADATNATYFTVGTTASPPADPAVGADDVESVAADAGSFRIAAGAGSTTSTVVKLISTGTHTLRVELLGD